jgi:GT2 family glycosyltransferase
MGYGFRRVERWDPATGRPPVSLVTLLWRNEEYVPAFLATLAAATRHAGATVEVVAVQNGPEGRAAARLFDDRRAAFPELRITLVREHDNLGFAGGADRGCRAASGDILVVANLDLEFDEDFVLELLRTGETLTTACLVAPSVRTPLPADRSRERSGHPPDGAAFRETGRLRRGPLHMTRELRDAPPAGTPVQVGNGSCLVFGRPLYDLRLAAAGALFDPEYHSFYEDVDLFWWAENAGVPVWFDPHLKVLHHQGGSFGGQYRFGDRSRDLRCSVMANYRITVWKNLDAVAGWLGWLAGECGYVALNVRHGGARGLYDYGRSWVLATRRYRAIRARRGSLRSRPPR